MSDQEILDTGGGASRSTEPAAVSSSGTDVELLYLIEAFRMGDDKFHVLFSQYLRRETEHVKELLQQAISERDKALELQLVEFLRRLDTLNHAHEQAREKERDFISRESFETLAVRTETDLQAIRAELIGREVFENHVSTNLKDHMEQRAEVHRTATTLADRVDSTAKALLDKVDSTAAALASASDKQQSQFAERIKKIEDFQSKLIGMALGAPIITAIIVYLLTRGSGGP